MLATLKDEPFSDPAWLYERKFDGQRCLAFRSGAQVRLRSRNRESANAAYPEIVEALARQDSDDFIVDGEVVAFDGNRTSFERLQRRMQLRDPERARNTGVAVFYYLFDVVHAEGHDTRPLPLRERKRILRDLVSFSDPIRFSPHRNADGEAYYRDACRKGWEGIIAKRADAPYVGRRSTLWLKFKCVNEQEFVIGGFTDPQRSREGLGALLLGYYEDGELVYAGKVGTGFDRQTLRDLRRRLDVLEQDRPPFGRSKFPTKGVHWVRPKLVAQIGFAEWTRDGQLRHPRFLGLRRDKDPREVVRERPA
jgi:DNA ligase D-like protein (predicted ligase)